MDAKSQGASCRAGRGRHGRVAAFGEGDDPSHVDNVAKPGTSRLTLVNGHPVVVDQAGQKAVSLDKNTGQPGEPVPLGIQPDDKLQVSGSRHNERLYIVAQRGVLSVCELAKAKQHPKCRRSPAPEPRRTSPSTP